MLSVIVLNLFHFVNTLYLFEINLLHNFLERFQSAKNDVVISKLANARKEASLGSKKRKATEKRKRHQSTNKKPGQKTDKTVQDDSVANVASFIHLSHLSLSFNPTEVLSQKCIEMLWLSISICH